MKEPFFFLSKRLVFLLMIVYRASSRGTFIKAFYSQIGIAVPELVAQCCVVRREARKLGFIQAIPAPGLQGTGTCMVKATLRSQGG